MHCKHFRTYFTVFSLFFAFFASAQGVGEDKDPAFSLKLPSNIGSDVRFDPKTGKYVVYQNIGSGNLKYRRPIYLTFEEYKAYRYQKSLDDYWSQKVAEEVGKENPSAAKRDGLKPRIIVNNDGFDRVFGGNAIDIKPQGSAELTFGLNSSRTENPAIPERQRSLTTFDFDQRIQLNLQGNIGEKLKVNFKYNTHAAFDFENQFKVDYTGYDDEIIKKIEAGNVSLPLNSSLITGSQSLFGIKTQLQFGRLTATTVLSQQKGQKSVINVTGGAQKTKFEIQADEYEYNKHFFLSNYFFDNYDEFMLSAPNVASGINITRVEVWVTNTTNATEETRNIIGFTDIGEDGAHFSSGLAITDLNPSTLPDNDFNSLFAEMSQDPGVASFSGATPVLNAKGFQAGNHYEKVESARRLPESSYTLNKRLGFISLNQPLDNDQVLGVSYEYTRNGKTYQVGVFSTDGVNGTDALFVKLLKSTVPNPRNKLWDLMMKNVYSIGAFQMSKEDFVLEVLYNNPKTGVDINYVPQHPIDDQLLVKVLNLDRYDPNLNAISDGVFDFIDNAATEGGTVNSRNGRIFFPVTEPFGKHLWKIFEEAGVDTNIIKSIVYSSLYDSTRVIAQQQPELNRFKLKGTYSSSSGSDISLNALNIPQGAVSVSAGGVRLQENVDFTVDYNMGRVKILNQGVLESGTPLSISVESNSLFNIQTKSLLGTRLDYRVHKDFNLGATILRLSERPLTQKVSFGDEPIRNTMIGFDGNYSTEAPILTKLVDKIPFIDTKEASNITVSGEYAQLIPGHSRAIGDEGATYIDDFEGSQYSIDMRSFNQWNLASTPQGQPDLFPEGMKSGTLENGYHRALFNWNIKDPLFFRTDNNTPDYFTPETQSNHFMREILEQEVFPLKEIPQGTPPNIATFDMAFFPDTRGPYNYNKDLTPEGKLADPESSWGGITRRLTTTDFETANIEYVQFWVMDPFNEDSENQTGGMLYFNLGNISEDVLRDSRKSFENGLPKSDDDLATKLDTTAWGVVPVTQSIVNAFDNSTNSNRTQDVGLDGLSDEDERSFFNDYLSSVQSFVNPSAFSAINSDPSNDNYHYYRGADYDAQQLFVVDRYKRYNGLEGNSPTSEDSPESYPTASTPLPSTEDLNLDNNLSETESYFQYEIPIFPGMGVGDPYITDVLEAAPRVKDGSNRPVKWYQFKIPIQSPDKVVNGVSDFRSIRFMRMFMKGFQQPVVLRFARLELIRGEWRKYLGSLEEKGEVIPGDGEATTFDIGAVNVEENGNRIPVNYVLPPDIVRETDITSANQRNLNEQSMALRVCDLKDGDARAAFRSTSFDVRSFEKMRMYVHAESSDPLDLIEYGDATVFIRLGTDFAQNYYEYEIPLEPTSIASASQSAVSVWPSKNNVEIEFSVLQEAKNDRNKSNFAINRPFIKNVGSARVWVVGNPNLADVTTIMIGVRNPSKDGEFANPWVRDDGLEKCFEVWVNELRLTDFKEDGGWAAVGRVSANLADFARVDLAGNISKPGFGSIEKRVSERQRETKRQVDATTTIQLDKFLPEKAGLVVPLYLGYSEGVSIPQFDPLNPDLEFEEITRNLSASEKRDRVGNASTYQLRRSINLANVRKEKPATRTRPDRIYDVENLALSYAYNEDFYRDIDTEKRNSKNYRVGLTYGFNGRPKTITPFKNAKWAKGKYLKLIHDFNFYLGPKQLGFRTNLDRSYSERLVRINTPNTLRSPSQFTKNFRWDRNYDLKYDLTKSLKFDYSAGNQAVVGEPAGVFEKGVDDAYGTYEEKKDSIWNNLMNLGETTQFTQNVSLKYKVPINKIPIFNWVNLDATYQGNYSWQRSPFAQDSVGNIIQNSRNVQFNANFSMNQLYSQVGFLKKVIEKKRQSGRRSGGPMGLRGKMITAPKDSTGTKKPKKSGLTPVEQVASFLMGINSASFKYSRNQGTMLPGFEPHSQILGMDNNFGAPGTAFVFGGQDPQFAEHAAEQDWLVRIPSLNRPYVVTEGVDYSYRVGAEPIKSLRIDINGQRTETTGSESFFRWNDEVGDFENQSPVLTGNVSVSANGFSSAFEKIDEKTLLSSTFEDFLGKREIFSERLAQRDGITDRDSLNGDFYQGYGSNSQNVVLLAFMSSYAGKNPGTLSLDPFNIRPSSNWRISYDGLSRIPWFQKFFKSFSISHAYKASMSTSFTGNLGAFNEGVQQTNASGDLVESRQFQTVNFSENFSPLINFDATLKSSLITKLEFRKDRTLTMNIANIQMTEVRGSEIVIGSGYRFKEVQLPFLMGGKVVKSDLNLRVDVSFRNNETIIRKVVEEAYQRTTGRRMISIKTSADYVINSRLNVRFFYDQQITKPLLSVPFPTSNTKAGLSLRLTLN